MPDLTYLGVPIKPATPDLTAQVTQILDFEPDAIILSSQGADCWNLVAGLGRLGWTPTEIPLVLATSCVDFEAMKQPVISPRAIYFLGGRQPAQRSGDARPTPRAKFEAEIYQTKPVEYGLPADQLNKGFATRSWSVMMSLWEAASDLAVDGQDVHRRQPRGVLQGDGGPAHLRVDPARVRDGAGAVRRGVQPRRQRLAVGRNATRPRRRPDVRHRPGRRDGAEDRPLIT